MAQKTWDPKQCVVEFAGQDLSGLADDFISVDYESDTFSDVAGADGEVARARTRDERATVTITLMQSSASNDVLNAAAILDKAAGQGVYPFFLRDLNGTTIASASRAWVMKPPPIELGKAMKDRQWKIRCANLKMSHGGLRGEG